MGCLPSPPSDFDLDLDADELGPDLLHFSPIDVYPLEETLSTPFSLLSLKSEPDHHTLAFSGVGGVLDSPPAAIRETALASFQFPLSPPPTLPTTTTALPEDEEQCESEVDGVEALLPSPLLTPLSPDWITKEPSKGSTLCLSLPSPSTSQASLDDEEGPGPLPDPGDLVPPFGGGEAASCTIKDQHSDLQYANSYSDFLNPCYPSTLSPLFSPSSLDTSLNPSYQPSSYFSDDDEDELPPIESSPSPARWSTRDLPILDVEQEDMDEHVPCSSLLTLPGGEPDDTLLPLFDSASSSSASDEDDYTSTTPTSPSQSSLLLVTEDDPCPSPPEEEDDDGFDLDFDLNPSLVPEFVSLSGLRKKLLSSSKNRLGEDDFGCDPWSRKRRKEKRGARERGREVTRLVKMKLAMFAPPPSDSDSQLEEEEEEGEEEDQREHARASKRKAKLNRLVARMVLRRRESTSGKPLGSSRMERMERMEWLWGCEESDYGVGMLGTKGYRPCSSLRVEVLPDEV